MGAGNQTDRPGIEWEPLSPVQRFRGYLQVLLERLYGYAELTRPVNVVFACLLTVIGAFVAGGKLATPSIGAALLATVGVMSGGNSINDYYDRDVDEINNPERPIPRGAVSERGALLFSLGMFGLAVLAAVPLSDIALLIVVANTVGGLTYTQIFKPLPGVGNALISYIIPSHFLLGGAAVGDPVAPFTLFALAALATFAREVVKDVEDIVGDRQQGLRTLPVVVGERPSLLASIGVVFIAVCASVLPFVWGTFGFPYMVAVMPANVVLLGATTYSLVDPAESQEWIKVGMFLAATAFVIGRIAVII